MKKKLKLTAKKANRYDLYEESVQNVDFETEFFAKIFKKYTRRSRPIIKYSSFIYEFIFRNFDGFGNYVVDDFV